MSTRVILDRAEDQALLDRIEELEDPIAARDALAAMLAGTEEAVPGELVTRLLAGESALRVWREHRCLSLQELAERTGTSSAHLGRLEQGDEPASLEELHRMAVALGVALDDLHPGHGS